MNPMFEFRQRWRLKSGLAAVLLLGSLVSACRHEKASAPAAPAGGPSLVLITIDTVRADHLGCYGAAQAETPNLDQLARQGVMFKAARTCVPLTLPSHVTMLTGLLPPCHGIHDNAIGHLRPEAVTLAKLLAARGYRTGAFVSAFVLSSKFGLSQGFEVYGDVPPRTLMSGLIEERRGDETLAEATQWFHGLPPGAAFFLWLHLFDAHSPYQPPPPFDAKFAGRPYDGEIAFVDSLVGKLLDTVRATRSDVFTAVLADHGESLGEHGELTHGVFVYDATMHIPWLMAGPGLPAGRVVETPVASVDLLPTLAAQLGFPVPELVQGRDLAPLIRGESGAIAPIYMESYYGFLNFRWSPLVAMTSGTSKVIMHRAPSSTI